MLPFLWGHTLFQPGHQHSDLHSCQLSYSPVPLRLLGCLFPLYPQALCWRILILPAPSYAEGNILVQRHTVILKQLCHFPHVILGCRLGLVCIQVKPEALLQMCTSCAPVPNGSIRVWNNNWSFDFVPSEHWERLSQRTTTNLVQSKKREVHTENSAPRFYLLICSYQAELLADIEVLSDHSK